MSMSAESAARSGAWVGGAYGADQPTVSGRRWIAWDLWVRQPEGDGHLDHPSSHDPLLGDEILNGYLVALRLVVG